MDSSEEEKNNSYEESDSDIILTVPKRRRAGHAESAPNKKRFSYKQEHSGLFSDRQLNDEYMDMKNEEVGTKTRQKQNHRRAVTMFQTQGEDDDGLPITTEIQDYAQINETREQYEQEKRKKYQLEARLKEQEFTYQKQVTQLKLKVASLMRVKSSGLDDMVMKGSEYEEEEHDQTWFEEGQFDILD